MGKPIRINKESIRRPKNFSISDIEKGPDPLEDKLDFQSTQLALGIANDLQSACRRLSLLAKRQNCELAAEILQARTIEGYVPHETILWLSYLHELSKSWRKSVIESTIPLLPEADAFTSEALVERVCQYTTEG